MAKITKNSELAETASKVALCEDPREAWIEISSGKYDAHFLKLATIYFADVYKNNNNISLDGAKIRQMFLENFDFRKSLIEFGRKKGLGSENIPVRNAMMRQMNFEGEDIAKIKEDYANQVKEMFFKDKETDGSEVPEVDDPILLLLKEEDRQKVILSKRYGGDMKTFTKLHAILQFADTKEQKNILKLLVPGRSHEKITSEYSKEMVDILGNDAIDEILSRTRCNNKIISDVIDKKLTQTISAQWMKFFLEEQRGSFGSHEISKKLVELIIHFLQGLDTKAPLGENTLCALEKCFVAIRNNHNSDDAIDFSHITIDIDSIEKALAEKIVQNWTLRAGFELCKESMKKKGSKKKVKA